MPHTCTWTWTPNGHTGTHQPDLKTHTHTHLKRIETTRTTKLNRTHLCDDNEIVVAGGSAAVGFPTEMIH